MEKVAVVLTIENEEKNRFRIIAYNNAAEAIGQETGNLKDLWKEGKLASIKGIGESIAGYLDELYKTGEVKHFNSLFKKVSPSVFSLLNISGLGPKKAFKLVKNLKIKRQGQKAIEELKKAALAGKIAVIPNFGEKSQTAILQNIEAYFQGKEKKARLSLVYADKIAQEISDYLLKCPVIKRVNLLGSLRRKSPTVGDIDLAIIADNNQKAIDWFIRFPKKQRLIEAGKTTASILLADNLQIDIKIQPAENYGSLLQHFTGSKEHNIKLRELALKKGYSLSEYGIKKKLGARRQKLEKFKDEKGFYNFLGMDFIPPELRENRGEIEASLKHQLPKLINTGDIKGDLHIHSNYDLKPSHDLGGSTIGELIKAARILKYQYIGLSDHSPSINNHSKQEIYDILSRRKEYFEQKRLDIKDVRVFIMLEVDILADNKLSLESKSLALLDGAIGSIHSSFNQSKEKLTERILTAIKNPYIKIIGHPTGRLLNKREGYLLDWDKIFNACLKYDKALEINAWPERLDLSDALVREAVKNGVKMVINSDAHLAGQMFYLPYGVNVARRGWAKKTDILNTLGYNEIYNWLKSK